jgi:hypothetical protein
MATKMNYDAAKKRAVYTFKNGKTLTINNMTEAKAKQHLERYADEWERRDCCLSSIDGQFTREEKADGDR